MNANQALQETLDLTTDLSEGELHYVIGWMKGACPEEMARAIRSATADTIRKNERKASR